MTIHWSFAGMSDKIFGPDSIDDATLARRIDRAFEEEDRDLVGLLCELQRYREKEHAPFWCALVGEDLVEVCPRVPWSGGADSIRFPPMERAAVITRVQIWSAQEGGRMLREVALTYRSLLTDDRLIVRLSETIT